MAIVGINDAGWAVYDNPQSSVYMSQSQRLADAATAKRMFGSSASGSLGAIRPVPNNTSPISTFVSENTGNAYGDNGSAVNQGTYNANVANSSGAINSFSATNPGQINNPFSGQVTNYQQRLSSLLDNPDSIKDSAAYQWRFNQGLDALNRQLGARGLLNSGNRLLETVKYGQGLASQEYGDQFKRLSDLYGTNSDASIGSQNANTGQWQTQGNFLNNYYNNSSGAANQGTLLDNNNRLGWASVFNNAAAPIKTTSSSDLTAIKNQPGQIW